ncbi:MAG TPA: HYR domain-containing protein, partial [Blastocatellia bacterium]
NDDFTQAPSQSVFASGGFRGDLTQVGPDGCLYVTQNGTRYNDGTVTNENSLVRICGGFAPPPGVGGCEISCPPNITRNADPRQCTTVVTYTLPTSRGDCDEGTRPLASNRVATCDPPPGSRFPVGDTTVTCTVTGTTQTARCSFTVTVTDNTPPVIACPPDQTVAASSNQCGGVANYATPPATDNCGGAAIVCAPPSGTPLPTGSSEVRCVARDDVGNESVCSFRVVVQDKELPKVVCPDSRTVEASASSCLTAVPGLALPSATDNCSGTVRVIFTRSDGKTNLNDPFSPGDTIITYTAIDASGNPSLPCQQTIRVNAAPKLVLPTEVNFGKVDFLVAAKKKPKKRAVTLADSTRTFTIRNDGCGDAVLTLKSINRTGSDVANNKITNTDDSDFFSVREIGGGFKTPKGDNTIRIPANPNNPSAQRKDIEIIVQPRLPERSASNSGLSTKQALPDPFTAELVFMDSAGATYRVALKASVSNDVRFINPEDIQRKAPFISFSKAGDIFTVEYTLYDADTGGKQANSASFVKSAKYEFLDDGGKVVETINVDLAGPIEAADLAKGQRFKVTKTFSGASDNSSITRVRVTVTDGAASPSLEGGLSSGQASQSFSPAQAFDYTQDLTIHLSAERLERFK